MRRLRLPIPTFKIHRLLLPLAVFVSGTIIFICGLVRSYYITTSLVKNVYEKRYIETQNDHLEWWVGFLLMGTAVLAIITVLLDRAWLFKLSVLMTGVCLVVSLFGFFWDVGEFSEVARNKRLIEFLEEEGNICGTSEHNFTYAGINYIFHDCECKKDDIINIGYFIPYSCELLDSLYYAHAVQAFALACAVAFTMFTIFSFVLILKRISQITTALHLDEKPLSEDFANISGDLYIDS